MLEKGAVTVTFDKIQIKVVKFHCFRDNILNRSTIKEEKKVGTRGWNPCRLDKSLLLLCESFVFNKNTYYAFIRVSIS